MILLRTEPKILTPVRETEWRASSQAQRKDSFGNENRTYFYIRARANDGGVVWTGWFEDRDDADAFLFALVKSTLGIEKELWRLPTPAWHPGIAEELAYDFATTSFLTGTSASNQTYNVPSDWNSSNNSIEVIGGGASGSGAGAVNYPGGGGGGAYAKVTNLTLTASGTATYRLEADVAGGSTTGAAVAGNAGKDAWFSNSGAAPTTTSQGALAKGGSNAQSNSSTGSGGAAASCIGSTTYSGGNATSGSYSCAGGGAAGKNGAGNNSGTPAVGGATGGSGDAGNGGAGGSGVSSGTANAGGNGTEWQVSPARGSGGGGGSVGGTTSNAGTGGAGGSYGGGGGGGGASGNQLGTGGVGKQGLIVITYEPIVPNSFPNLPMLGM